MYILRTVKLGGRKLMFTSFEIVSICVWLWYLFSDTCCSAAYSYFIPQAPISALSSSRKDVKQLAFFSNTAKRS